MLVVTMGFVHTSSAQAGKKVRQQQTVKKKVAEKKVSRKASVSNKNTITLASASDNQAYGNAPVRRFSIADPIINLLNQRAAGTHVPFRSSGIIGMPKGMYGFANGKIFLRSTTATSSGTAYGSGAVGTGTTIGGLGTSENVIGVNGKNPYAGPGLWGSKLPNNPGSTKDSTRRQ